LGESRCPAEHDKHHYGRNTSHKAKQTAKIQNILHQYRSVIYINSKMDSTGKVKNRQYVKNVFLPVFL
jgi:hypothetical protein